jgi:hypothetical protein
MQRISILWLYAVAAVLMLPSLIPLVLFYAR